MAAIVHLYAVDHPAAAGHFPGNPLIPGAVLLSDSLRAIEASLFSGAPVLSGVKAAKFHSPARPGDRVLIQFTGPAGGRIRFTCSVEGTTVLTGEAICDATTD